MDHSDGPLVDVAGTREPGCASDSASGDGAGVREADASSADAAGIRETANAAISATSSSTERSSKGQTQAPNSWVAITFVSPALTVKSFPPRAGNRTEPSSAVVPAPRAAAAMRWAPLAL